MTSVGLERINTNTDLLITLIRPGWSIARRLVCHFHLHHIQRNGAREGWKRMGNKGEKGWDKGKGRRKRGDEREQRLGEAQMHERGMPIKGKSPGVEKELTMMCQCGDDL